MPRRYRIDGRCDGAAAPAALLRRNVTAISILFPAEGAA
jgi:hypothetical protein